MRDYQTASYQPTRPARLFYPVGGWPQQARLIRSSTQLKESMFTRWGVRFAAPDEEVNLILDARMLSEPGYVLRTFKDWGGWDAFQFNALLNFLQVQPFRRMGRLFIQFETR